MSEAVLKARYSSYVPDPRRRKMIQFPLLPKDIEMSSEYMAMVVYQVKHTAAYQEKETRTQSVQRDSGSGWPWIVAGAITFAIIIVGIIVGYLDPGPISGVILPIGLGMWWLLYKLYDRLHRIG